MDGGLRHNSRKRPYDMMSSATLSLSPSPAHFGEPSNFFNNHHFRMRTSHPHNISQRPSATTDMASRSQRPRLEHRASQTLVEAEIIDLTEDISHSNAIPNSHPQPQLSRRDAGVANVVDLTSDGEVDDELVITGARQLSPNRRRHRSPPRPRRESLSPGLFVAQELRDDPRRHAVFPPPRPRAMEGFLQGIQDAHLAAGRALRDLLPGQMHLWLGDQGGIGGFAVGGLGHGVQAMPGPLDYHHAAFGMGGANRRPEHVPPPKAADGFTRSPKEEDVVICPSCEEELVHEHEQEMVGPVAGARKSAKGPSRKDMEEHPFWVVKECGHVYCNKCYQYRGQANKMDDVNFPKITMRSRKGKALTCNVDDCNSDVKAKDKWIGVFL